MAVGIGGIGLAHEDRDLAARIGRARRPPLAAVDHVVVAVAQDGALDVGGVGRGDGGLGHGEARADLAGEQRLQPLLLLRLVAVELQGLHVAGVGRRAVEHFRGHRRAAHDLAQRRVLEVGEARAARRMRQEEVPQAFQLGLLLEVFHQRRRLPAVAGLDLAGVLRFVGIDVPVHEIPELVLQARDLVGVGEFHGMPPDVERPSLRPRTASGN